MAFLPNLPLVEYTGLFLSGMQLSYTSSTVVTVASGVCKDSTNTNDIVIPTNLAVGPTNGLSTLANVYGESYTTPSSYPAYVCTLNTAVTGAGGIDVGTLTDNRLYAVYAIGSSTNQLGTGQPYTPYPGTVVASLSWTGPTLPQGYDMYRRIGAVLVDNAGNIQPFSQSGSSNARTVSYDNWQNNNTGASSANTFEFLAAADATATNMTTVGLLSPSPNARLVPPVTGNIVNVGLEMVGALGTLAQVADYYTLNTSAGMEVATSTGNPTWTTVSTPYSTYVSSGATFPGIKYAVSVAETCNFFVAGYVDNL